MLQAAVVRTFIITLEGDIAPYSTSGALDVSGAKNRAQGTPTHLKPRLPTLVPNIHHTTYIAWDPYLTSGTSCANTRPPGTPTRPQEPQALATDLRACACVEQMQMLGDTVRVVRVPRYLMGFF